MVQAVLETRLDTIYCVWGLLNIDGIEVPTHPGTLRIFSVFWFCSNQNCQLQCELTKPTRLMKLLSVSRVLRWSVFSFQQVLQQPEPDLISHSSVLKCQLIKFNTTNPLISINIKATTRMENLLLQILLKSLLMIFLTATIFLTRELTWWELWESVLTDRYWKLSGRMIDADVPPAV